LRTLLIDPLGPDGPGLIRDAHLFGVREQVEHRYRTRYLPAERLYEQQVRPADSADVIMDNTAPAAPVVLRWPG